MYSPKEPLTKEDRITSIDACTLTNHRGGDTLDSYNRKSGIIIRTIERSLRNW